MLSTTAKLKMISAQDLWPRGQSYETSTIVNYDSRGFIRLAAGPSNGIGTGFDVFGTHAKAKVGT